MSETTVTRRYALALYEEAEAKGITSKVDEAFGLIEGSLAGSRELVGFFASPVISRRKKTQIVERLFAKRVPPLVLHFMKLLVKKGRANLMPAITQAYRTMRNEQRGIVEAEARSPFALSAGEIQSLERALATATGKKVSLILKEDSTLIGGLIVRVGDTVYDSSVRRKLDVLKVQLEKGSFLNN